MALYFVYLYGCNKYDPKLIFSGLDRKELEAQVAETAKVDSFRKLIDREKMKEQMKDFEIEGRISNGPGPGPATEYNKHGSDYHLKKEVFEKLFNIYYSYGRDYEPCTCTCRLSIFAVKVKNAKDIAELDDIVRGHIM